MTRGAPFKRVLIANRGEIAVRIARTLKEMDITPIAVYSEPDRSAPHVRACDMAFPIGPGPAPESYLRGELLIEVAKRAKADAIHPGYGFLSENPGFADAVTKAGLVFIGPSAAAMRAMGNKTSARQHAIAAKVPVVPGSDGAVPTLEAARQAAKKLGYPVLLKAAAGGGGKGMRFVNSDDELASGFRAARSEAKSAFGDDTIYVEKAVVAPKHVEIQIFGDEAGNVVWLGERECSMQRRHQKIIEETPSPALTPKLREAMGEVACRAASAVGYTGAGTCEFLLDTSGNFYFLEMNTRLQVEHPVTELCCGLDLVEAQIHVAQGETLPWRQEQVTRQGHAIEARVYAENPERDFLPCPGHIVDLVLPSGPGVRVDSGVADDFEVPRFYDPLIAKISVWATDRERARRRLMRALSETAVKGLTTNTAFLRQLLDSEPFKDGSYHTGSVAALQEAGRPKVPEEIEDAAIAALVINTYRRDSRATRPLAVRDGTTQHNWRQGRPWRGS